MNKKTAILPILAVLSVAALIGGFAIQAADAQTVFRGIRVGPIAVSESGVQLTTDALRIGIGESGVSIIPNPER